MSGRDLDTQALASDAVFTSTPGTDTQGARPAAAAPALQPLLNARPFNSALPLPAVVIGELIAIADEGNTPLVMHATHSVALRARSTVDLHGEHIGRQVVLVFENGDPQSPIVMGVLRRGEGSPVQPAPGRVEIDADGERLLVTAMNQMVLRCGKASITLTQAGKVMIEGTYLSSRSSGVNRIKGGSVQLN